MIKMWVNMSKVCVVWEIEDERCKFTTEDGREYETDNYKEFVKSLKEKGM